MNAFPDKDPQATLEYTIDWSIEHPGKTITTSTWAVSPVTLSPLTIVSSDISALQCTVILSGGLVITDYQITNSIAMAGPLADEQTMLLHISQQ